MQPLDTTDVVTLAEFVPGKLLFADTETDGLLHRLTTIHHLSICNAAGQMLSCADQPGYTPIADGLRLLQEAPAVVMFNGITFDVPALKQVYPGFSLQGKLIDPLVMSRMAYPDIYEHGPNNTRLAPALRGSHKLEAWGDRLGLPKDDYPSVRTAELIAEGYTLQEIKDGQLLWARWSPTMAAYCDQDVRVMRRVFAFLHKRGTPPGPLLTEHQFAAAMFQQELRGAGFNLEAAQSLANTLRARLSGIERELIEEFGSWWRVDKTRTNQPDGTTLPKRAIRRSMKHMEPVEVQRVSKATGKPLAPRMEYPQEHYYPDAPYTPIYRHTFNPGSRDDCIFVLKARFGWKPTEHTATGIAKLDEDVLMGIREAIPAASKLMDYHLITKRLGQLSEGKEALIGHATLSQAGGVSHYRIHGRVNTLGTVTHRCSHSGPNLAQVPKADAKVPYGKEFRALFIPQPGRVLIGSDADALELRALAHYTAEFDGGEYARIVHAGQKFEDQHPKTWTDPHSWFRDKLGINDYLVNEIPDEIARYKAGRDRGKTARYATLYGAGAAKFGATIAPSLSAAKQLKIGKELMARISSEIAGERMLSDQIKATAMRTGTLIALDGRILPVRKPHAALNTLLQSAGAIIMKHVLLCHQKRMADLGYPIDSGWAYVLNIHDEIQAEVDPTLVNIYTEAIVQAYTDAETLLGLRCPLKGGVSVGYNWSDTH